METHPQRGKTNWESKLETTEIGERKEGEKKIKVVLLAGLQRLAQEAGLIKSRAKFNYIDKGSFGIMQCTYITYFDDGTSWTGSGDCNQMNTNAKFLQYPTSVAESRAEARSLRKALGIRTLSAEEIDMNDQGIHAMEVTPNKPIDNQVVRAIEKLCENKNISPANLLENILEKKRADSIYELSHLTVEEGQLAMEWLNNQKTAISKAAKSKSEEREERKKELLARKGQS